MNRILLLVAFLIFESWHSCLKADPFKERFLSYNIDNGLSNNSVNSIVKDQDGFIWIATEDGLNRFDGYNIEKIEYVPGKPAGLAYNSINDLFRDSNNDIWLVLKNDFLQKVNKEDLSFHTVFNGYFQGHYCQLKRIVEDNQRRLWISTGGDGILLYDLQSGNMERLPINSPFSFDIITAMVKFQDQIWFTNDQGQLAIYNLQNDLLTNVDLSQYLEGSQSRIEALYINQNHVFIGTISNGVVVLNHKFEKVRHLKRGIDDEGLTSNIIKCIEPDYQGRIWIGSSIRGISVLDPVSFKIRHILRDLTDYSLSGEGINCLYSDDLGFMWVGTYVKGFNLWLGKDQKFTHFNLIESWKGQNVPAILEDPAGYIWIANGGDLSRIDAGYEEIVHFQQVLGDPFGISDKKVRHLTIDSRQNLILGTRHHGLIIRSPDGKIKTIPGDRILGKENELLAIASLTVDREDNLLISSSQGLFVYHQQSGKTDWYSNDTAATLNIGLNMVKYTVADSLNNYWIATGKNGLLYLNPRSKEYTAYTLSADANQKTEEVNHLLLSGENIWIGTNGAGLGLLEKNSGKYCFYTIENGLPSNVIKSIEVDKNGLVWASTNNGVFSLNPVTDEVRKFTLSDGLQGQDFIANSSFQNKNGIIYFGGYQGFNLFHPDSIRNNRYIPKVRISQVLVQDNKGNQQFLPASNSSLPAFSHRQKNLTLSFSSFNYNHYNGVHYRYRMDGLEDQWNFTDGKQNINYRNMPPGNYTFRVRSTIDQQWNDENEATFSFNIARSPWQTPLAYTSYLMIFFGLLLLSRKITIERIKLRNSLQIKELETEKVREIDALKTEFYTNFSHELKTPLTLIITPLRKMFDENDFLLDKTKISNFRMILNNAERLQKLINQILDLTKLQNEGLILNYHYEDAIKSARDIIGNFDFKAISQGITLQVNSYHQSCWGFYDKDVLEKILFNLVSNALKHTPANGRISIRLHIRFDQHRHPAWLNVVVSDNGTGMEKNVLDKLFSRFFYQQSKLNHEKSDGIGLSLVKKLIEMHQGEIKVKSRPGAGTSVLFRIPLSYTRLHETGIITDRLLPEEKSAGDFLLVPDEKDEKPLILIAEDEPELLGYLIENLKNSYQVLAAKNGSEGLRIAQEKIPDLVLSDLMMPEMNGIEFCSRLKSNPVTAHIPFIMLSARGAINDRISTFQQGADDHIAKPFNFLLLRSRIVNLLKNRDRLKSKYQGSVKELPEKPKDPWLEKFYDILENNYQLPEFGVEEIERQMNLSHVQLYRKIKALTGQSGNILLRNFRLQKARKMLETGRFNISEVAYRVGFNDPAYFSRCFSRFMGLSPSDYTDKHNLN